MQPGVVVRYQHKLVNINLVLGGIGAVMRTLEHFVGLLDGCKAGNTLFTIE